jgi:2-hydroxy-4-(methylsulfanyl)butanoate S-methyltransferase
MTHTNSTSQLASTRAPGDSASAISAIAYGFMGSQALFSALELGMFTALADGPLAFDELASRLGAPTGPLRALLATCLALDLISWDGERYGNSSASQRFLVRSSRSFVGDYYLRQIDAVLYDRMRLVRALLRGEPVDGLAYADALDAQAASEDFIRGQHAGSLAAAALLARTLDLSSSTCLLDLGGGSGAFAIEAARHYPELAAVVYDLPQVTRVTERIIEEAGLEGRITCASGDLREDAWPGGADLILLSYIVSCYPPATLHALMARCFAYLPRGGRLVIHDFALAANQVGPRNTALFLFGQLTVSAQTTPYTAVELSAAMRAVGFEDVTSQPFLPDLTFLLTACKPA